MVYDLASGVTPTASLWDAVPTLIDASPYWNAGFDRSTSGVGT